MVNTKRVIVGLGNPGEKYLHTRHNVGVMLIDQLAMSWEISESGWSKKRGVLVAKTKQGVLVKSEGYFMNESGKMIQALGKEGWEPEQLYVAHDDLDLPLGEFKIQFAKGPALHGGVNDIERVVGKQFWRIRIGVDNRNPESRISGLEYVLQQFSEAELVVVDKTMAEIIKSL